MTRAIRTTRNSRTKIFAACPARIFAAGSNAGKNPCGWLRIARKRSLRYPAVSSSFRRRRAHRRTAAFVKCIPQPPRRPHRGQGWPHSMRDQTRVSAGACQPEPSEGPHSSIATSSNRSAAARASTFWRYAKMTTRERVSKFAQTDAVSPPAKSRHPRRASLDFSRFPSRRRCSIQPRPSHRRTSKTLE